MKITPNNPPRVFTVGAQGQVDIKDCGRVQLEPDEQVTFTTEAGGEYDLSRKDFGFYATPSLNGRLPNFGLRGVLIKNRGTNRFFVFLVEKGKESAFNEYCVIENLTIVTWMDDDASLNRIEDRLAE